MPRTHARSTENLAGGRPPPPTPTPAPPLCAVFLPLRRTSCERLPSGPRQLEHLDGLEPPAVAVEGGQRGKHRAAHQVEQGVALRGGELRPQQRHRLQAVREAEGLADGSSDEPVPDFPGLEDYPPLHPREKLETRAARGKKSNLVSR